MIGGTDIVIDTTLGETALDVAVRAILRAWPAAVFDNGSTGERSPCYEDVAFGRTNEVFVSSDLEAAQAWDEHGAIPSLSNTMIHLLVGPADLTVVVDDPETTEMRGILAAIRDGLRMDIFSLTAANAMPKLGRAA